MPRLATNAEIEIAQNSLRSLRIAINNTTRGVGIVARERLRVLSSHVNATSTAMDPLRSDIYNPTARSLFQEFERLERVARDLADDLANGARYEGPARASMSASDKVKYVSANGSDAFLKLPT